MPLGIAPGKKVQVAWRILIGSGNVYEVAEIHWGASSRGRDLRRGNLLRVLEFTGGRNEQILPLDLQHTTGEGNVPGTQELLESCRLDAIGGQLLLGIFKEDLLREDASAVNLRHLRHGQQ